MFFTTGAHFAESADNQMDSRSLIYRMEDCCTKDLNKVFLLHFCELCVNSHLVIEDKNLSLYCTRQ